MINQITARHSEPEKKCLAQCFPSHVFYLRKKKTFGFTKKAKSQTEKTPNCHKTKMRMKEKKNRQNNVSHHILTHPIEAPLHTYTNSPNFMSSNQSINKTPNSRFLLFSHRCTQTLGFNAYLSPDQDKPGLTRLT